MPTKESKCLSGLARSEQVFLCLGLVYLFSDKANEIASQVGVSVTASQLMKLHPGWALVPQLHGWQ